MGIEGVEARFRENLSQRGPRLESGRGPGSGGAHSVEPGYMSRGEGVLASLGNCAKSRS